MTNFIHPSLQQNRKPIGHDLFVMWRCVVCMAHTDGLVQGDERSYLEKVFSSLHLGEEQRQILQGDMAKAQDFAKLFVQINNPAYRAMVYDFCRLLAFKDGVRHPAEEDLLKRIHGDLLPPGRLEEIKDEVRTVLEHKMTVHDTEIDQHRPIFDPKRPSSVLAWAVDELFLRLGIDLLRD